jgi:hypothetical protein
MMDPTIQSILDAGVAIPASPLALRADRTHDERRQRALWRYYLDAGAGGIAIGVHTTQFEIRDPQVGLFEPLLAMAREEFDRADEQRDAPAVRIAGLCGPTGQATAEAATARDLGYHAGLLSLAALADADDASLIAHCRAVAEVLPVVGFYLQPAVGGRRLGYGFWRAFAEIENVAAIKLAPFNRYYTLDAVRAVAEAGRDDIALYTGNDDSIVMDLLTPWRFEVAGEIVERRMVGGLLGHWSAWTKRAVQLLDRCQAIVAAGGDADADILALAGQVTDCNAAFFDVANDFAGCIAGMHEVLRRQGLLEGIWCLDPAETLSPGQADEIDRVWRAYPHLNDDAFVRENLDRWLA